MKNRPESNLVSRSGEENQGINQLFEISAIVALAESIMANEEIESKFQQGSSTDDDDFSIVEGLAGAVRLDDDIRITPRRRLRSCRISTWAHPSASAVSTG